MDAATVNAVTADAAAATIVEAAMAAASKSSLELVYHDMTTAVGTIVQYLIWVQYIGDNLDKDNSDEYAGALVQIRYKTEKEENEAAIQPVGDVAVEPDVTLESSSGEENRIMTAKVYNVDGDTQPSDDIAEETQTYYLSLRD